MKILIPRTHFFFRFWPHLWVLYMVEINGDTTFYPNRVTFWVFVDAYHLLSDAPIHPILIFLEGLRMSLWVPLIFWRTTGFFYPLLGDFLYQYFKKLWKLTNFRVNYLKDRCGNEENKLYHESTNVLKFSKHPQLLFQVISQKNWHQGIFWHQKIYFKRYLV